MKAIVWNCRGLEAAQVVHELAKLVRVNRPKLLFLLETKRNSNEMCWLSCRLGFDSCFAIEVREEQMDWCCYGRRI